MKIFFNNEHFPRNLGFIFGALASLIYFDLSTEAYSLGPSSVGSSFGLLLTYITTPMICLLAYLIGASLGFLIFAGRKRRNIASLKGLMSSVIIIGFLALSVGPFYHNVHAHFVIKEINSMNRAQLHQAVNHYKNASSKEKPYIYSAIVTNPNADNELYHQLVLLQDPSLAEDMWSITGLLGKNRKGLSVLRLIEHNKKKQS